MVCFSSRGHRFCIYLFGMKEEQVWLLNLRSLSLYSVPCKDEYISMIALRRSEWKRFLEVIGDGKVPECYSSDDRFKDWLKAGLEYSDVFDRLFSPWLMSHSRNDIFNRYREKMFHLPQWGTWVKLWIVNILIRGNTLKR
jgi:hypothetical protein